MTSRQPRTPHGFTLVELLVVITIIGMLMSLLLPAVQQAREAGRRNTCANNQRNLGIATQTFHSARTRYPGFVEDLDQSANGVFEVSWLIMLMPYIEHGDIYDEYQSLTRPKVTLDLLVCPSDPPEIAGGAPLSYVGNTGFASNTWTDAKSLNPANGVFLNMISGSGVMKLAYLEEHDGTSNTLVVSENIDVDDWTLQPVTASKRQEKQFTGFVWHDSSNADRKINGKNGGLNLDRARPSSHHPDGVGTIFADGHFKFLSESCSYKVYTQLMTSYSALSDANSSVTGYLLNDADY